MGVTSIKYTFKETLIIVLSTYFCFLLGFTLTLATNPEVSTVFKENTTNFLDASFIKLGMEPNSYIEKDGKLAIPHRFKNSTPESYDIYIYGVPKEVSKVIFPTWSLAISEKTLEEQDDLLSDWETNNRYEGENLGGGIWKYTVENNEFNDYGKYQTDRYYFDSNDKPIDIHNARIEYVWIIPKK